MRNFNCEFSKLVITTQYLQNLLFELENQIKFYSLKHALKRGSKTVEEADVAKTLKKFGSPNELVKQIFKDAKSFDKKQSAFFKILELLENFLGSANPIVLDAGCGWGRFILRLQKHCGKNFEMVGVDIDDISLKYGKELSKSLEVTRSKVEYLPIRDSIVDVILCSGVIHEIKTFSGRKATVEEFRRVLKPGGVLCIVDAFSTNRMVDVLTRVLKHVTSKIEWFFVKSALERILKENMFKTMGLFEIESRALGTIKVLTIILTKNNHV